MPKTKAPTRPTRQYFCIHDRPQHRIYEGRFENAGPVCVAIVATCDVSAEGQIRTWAAYIGGLPNQFSAALTTLRFEYARTLAALFNNNASDYPSEEETLLEAAKEGNKLLEEDARHYFYGPLFDAVPYRD